MALEKLNQTNQLILPEMEMFPPTKVQTEVLRRSVDLRLQRLVRLSQKIEILLATNENSEQS
jgi:hypothetical protein